MSQSKPTKSATEPKRTPIAVSLLKFPVDDLYDGPGASVTSSVRHRDEHKTSRHTIEYLPWMRHFRVTYYPTEGGELEAYVHEDKPSHWVPLKV